MVTGRELGFVAGHLCLISSRSNKRKGTPPRSPPTSLVANPVVALPLILDLEDLKVALAKRLVESSFADRAFFANSGTEANEAAIKFSRKLQWVAYPHCDDPPADFLAFDNCFHGQTMVSVALTSKSQYRDPFPCFTAVTFP